MSDSVPEALRGRPVGVCKICLDRFESLEVCGCCGIGFSRGSSLFDKIEDSARRIEHAVARASQLTAEQLAEISDVTALMRRTIAEARLTLASREAVEAEKETK